jgi:C4-dicarboxylate transporter, DctM subunit
MEAAAPYLLLALLLLLVFAGVNIAVCLGVVSFIAIYYSTQDIQISISFLSSTAYEALRDYVFAVVPLFLLMGEFIARSGVASDLYWGIDRWLSRLPGRFGYATVLGNVVFGFVTGTSLASATAFTAIAYPQMKRAGYNSHFSLGLISGSACLGMLIPPSLLMVVWGILTDLSIGHLFLAGIIPGLMLAGMMIVYIFLVSLVRPDLIGHGAGRNSSGTVAIQISDTARVELGPKPGGMFISVVGLLAIIVIALGGIWTGFFTPTEGAGIGALIALFVGIAKGMRWAAIYDVILSVGRTATPLMIIVFAAQMYSRTLSMSGIGTMLQNTMTHSGLPEWGVILFMLGVWFVLGMLIDSISIMLLTVPIFAPVALALGWDPLVFALVGILTIEAGLLTPPFGMIVYAVRSVIPYENVSMATIFLGSSPFWIMLLILTAVVMVAPATVTYLTKIF